MKRSYYYLLALNTILTGDRIILRPVTLADAEAMHEYKTDEKITRFVRFDT